jgi:hypothetical protein
MAAFLVPAVYDVLTVPVVPPSDVVVSLPVFGPMALEMR